MKAIIERLRRAAWTFKQPLTRLPLVAGSPVSDLFIWRNSNEWETFFELTDLPALFAGFDNAERIVTLVFFDVNGQIFFEKIVEILPGRRYTLALSKIIGKKHGSVGTFSVFHSYTPQHLIAIGSSLAERGYVSYRFRDSPIRSYVHGNLDAITRLPNKSLQLLGGQSIWRRKYNLQYSIDTPCTYELGIVNPTSKKQRIVCRILLRDGNLFDSQAVDLPSRGSYLFKVTPKYTQQKIVISSKLIMARPLVYRFNNQTVDVCHG